MAGTTGTHDVGGLDDEVGPIDVDSGSKKYKLWELQTHCLLTLLSKKGLITVDEVGVVLLLFVFAAVCNAIFAVAFKLATLNFLFLAGTERNRRIASSSCESNELL